MEPKEKCTSSAKLLRLQDMMPQVISVCSGGEGSSSTQDYQVSHCVDPFIFKSPSATAKVHNWLNTCNYINAKDNLANVTVEKKRSVLIRMDFGSTRAEKLKLNKNVCHLPKQEQKNSRKKLLTNTFKAKIDLYKSLKPYENLNDNDVAMRYTQMSIAVHRNSEDLTEDKEPVVNISKSPKRKLSTNSETPMSPESQKKKELCSYLQLVNLNSIGTSEGALIQNRRSVRVKNLILLSEKKELEKKLNTTNIEKEGVLIDEVIPTSMEENLENNESLAKKSFTELNIDPCECRNTFFDALFTKPSSILEQQDFDDVMLNFMKREEAQVLNVSKAVPEIKKVQNHMSPSKINEIILGKDFSSKKGTRRKPYVLKILKKKHRTLTRKYLLRGKNTRTLRSRRNLSRNDLLIRTKSKPPKKQAKTKKVTTVALKEHNYSIQNQQLAVVCDTNENSLINKNIYDKSFVNKCVQKENIGNEVLIADKVSLKTVSPDPSKQTEIAQLSLEYISPDITNKKPINETVQKEALVIDLPCKRPSILKEKLIFNENTPPCLGFRTSEINAPSLSNMPLCSESAASEPSSDSTDETLPDSNTPNLSEDFLQTKMQSPFKSFESFEPLHTNAVTSTNADYIPLNKDVEVNSLLRSLTETKRRSRKSLEINSNDSVHNWEDASGANKLKERRNSHSVYLSEDCGDVFNAVFIDYSLIIVQELRVTFYSQSPLGNVLGAQNMWLPKGHVQRLVLDNGCIQKKSLEKVINLENSVAYVELWTKEHKSDKRERPVADVFAAIYFWRNRQLRADKKVLQLQNIKGHAEDVQYIVINNSRNIILSWNEIEGDQKVTIVRCYCLESDYQTVASIKEIQAVDHCVSSLNNIEDGESLFMGFGENKATLWNLEYGYIVATIDVADMQPQPRTVWVKCERGFLFTLQHKNDGNLRLIAINGINHSWKQLTSFKAPREFNKLRGACIENGILVTFYENGVLCWNVQTGELLMEEVSTDLVFFPSSKHVVIIAMGQVLVKHAVSYLITM